MGLDVALGAGRAGAGPPRLVPGVLRAGDPPGRPRRGRLRRRAAPRPRPAGRRRAADLDAARAVLDRILWWGSSALAFVLITGTAGMLLSLLPAADRPASGPSEGLPNPGYRGDQSAGFLLGAAKGLIVVAFLAAGIAHYAPDYLKAGGWVGDQVGTSQGPRPLGALPAGPTALGGPGRPATSSPTSGGWGSTARPRRRIARRRSRGPSRSTTAPGPARLPWRSAAVEPSSGLSEADLERALDEVRRDLERLDAAARLRLTPRRRPGRLPPGRPHRSAPGGSDRP